MGYRMHVCKTYKIEYGRGLFNCQQSVVDRLLERYATTDEMWSSMDNTTYELSKEMFEDFINNLQKNKEEVKEILQKEFDKLQYMYKNVDIEEVYKEYIEGFIEVLQEADKNLDYIRLDWF